jgi:hypothetical protein
MNLAARGRSGEIGDGHVKALGVPEQASSPSETLQE